MITSVMRWCAIAGIVAVLVWLCLQHEHAGMKGRYVPIPNLAVCIISAAMATFLCKRYWLWFAAPFVAGVVGVLSIGQSGGPFGGVVGLVVGILVVLVPFGNRVTANKA